MHMRTRTCTHDSKIIFFLRTCSCLQHRAKAHEKIIASSSNDGSFIPHADVTHASATVRNGGKLDVPGAKSESSTSEAVAAVDAHSSAAKVPAQPQRPAAKSSSQHRTKAHEKIIASSSNDGSFIPHADVTHASATVRNGGKLDVPGAKSESSTSEAVAAVDAHSSAAKVPAQPQRPAAKSSSVLAYM